MRLGIGTTVIVIIVVGVVAVAAIGGYYFFFSGGRPKTFTIIMANGVSIHQDQNYNPPSATVAPGTTVVFNNQDSALHSVTFTSGPSGVQLAQISSDVSAGASYSVTLTVPGTYVYHCIYHVWMQGTIVVQGTASGPAY